MNRNTRVIVGISVVAVVFASTLRSFTYLSQVQPPSELKQRPPLRTRPPFLPPKNSSLFRPTTSLSAECTADPHQPLVKIDTFSEYSKATRYFEAAAPPAPPARHPNNDGSTTSAVCEFVVKENAVHFAHSMQQLYGCFSYWQTYHDAGRRLPILILSNKVHAQLKKNAFIKGFLKVLKVELKVQIMTKPNYMEAHGGNNQTVIQTIDVPGGYILSHAETLNQLLQRHYNLSSIATRSCGVTPRIAILNRRKSVGRSIVNAPKLVDALSNYTKNSEIIPIDYFEGRSFQEQVSFFRNVDILLSPHGAQLTGLPFMSGSTSCSQLIEVFPKHYALPSFYGSLATNSGTGYAYVYLSRHSWKLEEQAQSLSHRIQARATNLCPAPSVIQEAMQTMVDNWRDCCRQKRQQEPTE
jgi:hypothetical protein